MNQPLSERPPLRIALLASCTAQLLPKLLTEELREYGVEADIWCAGFDQFRQQLLKPDSEVYSLRPDAILLYLDGEDLFRACLSDPFSMTAAEREQVVADQVSELKRLVRRVREELPDACILLNTISFGPINSLTGLEYNCFEPLSSISAAYNKSLYDITQQASGLIVIDTAALISWLGYKEWFDARLWYLARSRWSRAAMRLLAQHYSAALRGWLGMSRKCIVVDLDNTLWGGVVGEDGAGGIALGEEGIGLAFADFQRELLNLRRKGVLLAVCSKNNPGDVKLVFESHPAMRLKESDFAAIRINWEDKPSNLVSIAAELNIGLDSLAFIDDNPVERALVRETLPEVLVPEWPADPVHSRAALLDLALRHFPKVRLTSEDAGRADLYQAQTRRRALAESSGSLEDYYRSLGMVAKIGFADALTIPRIAQLTQKTNQFNLTTRRYTESDIKAFTERPNAIVLWLELTDRLGSNGLVGVAIFVDAGEGRWLIDTFLLSCRVIGRTAERAFLSHACGLLLARGASILYGEYRPTARNEVVRSLYPSLGFSEAAPPVAGSGEGSLWWELPLRDGVIPAPEWIDIVSVRKDGYARSQTD